MTDKLLMIIIELIIMFMRSSQKLNDYQFDHRLNRVEKRYLKLVGDERLIDGD